jgi:hypothetical protein
MLLRFCLFAIVAVGGDRTPPLLDASLPWAHVPPAELPRVCVLARTYPSPRMRRLLPAFLSSLLGGGYPALEIFLLDTEFLAGDSFPALAAAAGAAAAAAAPGGGAVHVARLSALDADVADAVLGVTGWAQRPAADFAQAKGPRWVRGWVATDVLLNRLLRCGGQWARACGWDAPWEGSGNGTAAACDYYLFTNTDNSYGAEFLPQVWANGVAPLWPGKVAFWGGAGAAARRGRDVVGVHYVTYYTVDGGGAGGTEATRFAPRRVALPLAPGGEGQSLDLGALLWAAPALRDAGGGGFLVRELREAVVAAVGDAAGALTAAGGGGGGGGGAEGFALPLRVGGGAAAGGGGGVAGALCAAGVALACGEALAGPSGEAALARRVEARLLRIWPSVYARDHVMASQVHGGAVLPRRLLARARTRSGAGTEDAALARALAAAAAADGRAAPQPQPPPVQHEGDNGEDPVAILPGLLFLHQ